MVAWLVLTLALAACTGESAAVSGGSTGCADVVAVSVDPVPGGGYSFAVTVRSDDTGWEAYADRWEVLVEGVAIAERILTHPHVDEQPFTRSQSGIDVPPGSEVLVRAHHSAGGWCGAEETVQVPG